MAAQVVVVVVVVVQLFRPKPSKLPESLGF
jgi:hypothetical protein